MATLGAPTVLVRVDAGPCKRAITARRAYAGRVCAGRPSPVPTGNIFSPAEGRVVTFDG